MVAELPALKCKIMYTRSSPRADLIGAFSIGAQFQKVPEIFTSCGFLHLCVHHFRNKHEMNQENEWVPDFSH